MWEEVSVPEIKAGEKCQKEKSAKKKLPTIHTYTSNTLESSLIKKNIFSLIFILNIGKSYKYVLKVESLECLLRRDIKLLRP